MTLSSVHSTFRSKSRVSDASDQKSVVYYLTLIAISIALTAFVLGGRWSFIRLIDPLIALKSDLQRTVNFEVVVLEIRLICLSVGVFFLMSLSQKISARVTYILMPVIALLIWFVASALWTVTEANYLSKLIDIAYLFAGLLYVAYAVNIPDFIKVFLYTMFVSLTILSFMGLQSYLTGGLSQISAEAIIDTTRLSILGGGPNTFGRQMGVLLIICVSQILTRKNAMQIAMFGGVGALALMLCLLSGSRGALLATISGLAILFLGVRISARLLVYIVGGVVLGVVVSVLTGNTFFDSFFSSEFFQNRWVNETYSAGYASGRDRLLETAFDLWMTSPVIGTGLNSFAELNATGDLYAHNVIAETAQETGLIGLSILFMVAVRFFRSSTLWGSPTSALIVAIEFMWFTGSMTSGDLYDSRNIFVFALIAAAAAPSGDEFRSPAETGFSRQA